MKFSHFYFRSLLLTKKEIRDIYGKSVYIVKIPGQPGYFVFASKEEYERYVRE